MSDEEKAAGVSSAVNHYSSDLEAYLSTGSDVRSDESSTFSTQHPRGNVLQRFADSFRPINLEDDGIDTLCMTPLEISIYATARHPLARSLKLRHLQMIAIGGSIGTGLFIGSGYALSQSGPASVLIGYTLVGFSMFCVVMALGELLVQFPVLGLFNAFFLRFLEPTWGWLLGLLYAMSWLISLPSELVACR
jgi:amino acid transporter